MKTGSITGVDSVDLAPLLADNPPFDALDPGERSIVVDAARIEHFGSGSQIIDAFLTPTDEVFVVVEGTVDLWNNPDGLDGDADERVRPGGAFGFSAMLTERSVGPRAVAVEPTSVARIPAAVVAPAFASRGGARFLAAHLSRAHRGSVAPPSYGLVDELVVTAPFEVDPDCSVGDVARRMTEAGRRYAAVPLEPSGYGLITDAVLREHVLVAGLPADTPARSVLSGPAPTARLGDSAAEAMIQLLDAQAEFLLVTDRTGALRGVIEARDFVVAPTTAGISLREQLMRSRTVDELTLRARRLPGVLDDLLDRGLASGKVIAVHSATVDAIVRRALSLVFARHADLSVDAFTWLSLGSNGRREAVLSSDVDAAVAFDDGVEPEIRALYRAAFAEVNEVLVAAGLSIDEHGTTPRRERFARTNSEWRAAAEEWLAAPAEDQGAIMTSLLVDGRPIHGDPGLPAVTEVFGELRRHPATMRLLLRESLSRRAKLHTMRDVLSRRAGTFDIKQHALLPVINIARWAALSVGSAELATTERLRAAAGSQMMPDDQAGTLIEVFEALQRVRLRHQLGLRRADRTPSNVMDMSRVSPIDRSILAQAVREVSAVQRRMDKLAVYLPTEEWLRPPENG